MRDLWNWEVAAPLWHRLGESPLFAIIIIQGWWDRGTYGLYLVQLGTLKLTGGTGTRKEMVPLKETRGMISSNALPEHWLDSIKKHMYLQKTFWSQLGEFE